jgi:hypothetical protein
VYFVSTFYFTLKRQYIQLIRNAYVWLFRERPFNLKGGVMVFFEKNILIPNVAEKNILILVEEKNNNLIQSFSNIT